jgi:hypothetical protein
MAAYHDQMAMINEQWDVWNTKTGEATIPLMAEVNIQLISLYIRFVELASAINLATEAAQYLFSLGTVGDISGAYSEFETTVSEGDTSMAALRGSSGTSTKKTGTAISKSKALYWSRHPDEAKAAGIAGYAKGGWVTKPTVALMGENEPELVTPLSKLGKSSGSITQINNFKTVAFTEAQVDRINKRGARSLLNAIRTQGG